MLGAVPAQNVVVRFFTPDTDTEIHKACAPTDGAGDFTIYGIPPGTYDVGVKPQGCLSILAEDKVFTDGNTTDIDFGDLYAGDLDGNDVGTILDYSIFAAQANGKAGDCYGYPGNWLIPECPAPPPTEGACYGYIIE